MRPAHIFPLFLALALAACEDPLTSPEADQPSPSPLIMRGSGYTATVLPFVPGGMNDQGDIVGHWLGDPVYRFFPSGSVSVLHPLSGFSTGYVVTDINNNGRIVGYVRNGPGVYWHGWNAPPIQIDGPAGSTVIATAINLAGVVVGNYYHPSFGFARAFRWKDGVFQDIHPKGWETSVALDVNDAGAAVGYGWKTGQHAVALRWPNSTLPAIEELSTGWMSMAIDNDGTAIGSADGFSTMKYWTIAGATHSLSGPQASSPDDLSETGRVAGWSYGYSIVNPHRPWTVFQGITTWLPVTDSASTYNVFDLDVNTCGWIVGVQQLVGNPPTYRGLLWSRNGCDVLPPQP